MINPDDEMNRIFNVTMRECGRNMSSQKEHILYRNIVKEMLKHGVSADELSSDGFSSLAVCVFYQVWTW